MNQMRLLLKEPGARTAFFSVHHSVHPMSSNIYLASYSITLLKSARNKDKDMGLKGEQDIFQTFPATKSAIDQHHDHDHGVGHNFESFRYFCVPTLFRNTTSDGQIKFICIYIFIL